MSCKYAANLQEEIHTEMWFQKELRVACSTSAWVLHCKFAGDLQNTFLEEHLWGTGSEFYIIYPFYWLVFIIYRYIFQNNFPSACCNWSTYYIFVSIFNQTNVCCSFRNTHPQIFFKKDYLIYIRYKCEEE